MSAEITIRLGSDDFRDFVSMLGDGTHLVWRRILKQIGLILTSSAQEAFEEERLGDIEWPARYPNQTEPYANIAGIVSDLGKFAIHSTRKRMMGVQRRLKDDGIYYRSF